MFQPRSRRRSLFTHKRFLLAAVAGVLTFLYFLSSDSAKSPWSSRSEKFVRNRVQADFSKRDGGAGDAMKAEAVRETMKDSFWRYREVAWGMDEVRPVSGRNRTSRNGWAATIVDSLTTTAIMGLEREFKMELEYALTIDFNTAIGLVDPFETTIRYLGALTSTVDLLDSGTLSFSVPAADRSALLAQAVLLADKLAPSFDSPTGLVWPRVNWTTNVGCREHPEGRPFPDYPHATIGPARAGSNWLENMSLSRLTGDPSYGRNATKAWKPLVWNKWVEDWPGIIDGPWDIMTGVPYERQRSWDAGHDSYYEYLIKSHILLPRDPHTEKYRTRWLEAVDSTAKNLIFRSTPPQHKFLHKYNNGRLINEMGHLACFAGGNMMLGGRYTGEESALKLGEELVETCRWMYESNKKNGHGGTGVGPEYVAWVEGEPGVLASYGPQDEGQWKQARDWGFWVVDARWMLRPETVESYFYAYRITGDKKYQDWAWEAYTCIIAASKATHGYAEIQDVTHAPGIGNQFDRAESFWSAETLKYLYMIFADEKVGNLDEWVFSTEAHPFRITGWSSSRLP